MSYNPKALEPGKGWSRPLNPHPWDQEFDGAALDSALDLSFTPSSNAVDITDDMAVAEQPRLAFNQAPWRRGLVVQARLTSETHYISFGETIPTNLWMELRFIARSGLTLATGHEYEIGMSAESGGQPSEATDFVAMRIAEGVNTNTLSMPHIRGTASQSTNTINFIDPNDTMPISYLAIHKVGNSLHSYFSNESRRWMHMDESDHTGGGAFDRLHLRISHSSSLTGFPYPFLIRHWRFLETDQVPA